MPLLRLHSLCALSCAVLFGSAAFAANPPGYDDNTVKGNSYKKSSGAWETAANWETGSLPNKDDSVWISHKTSVTLSSKAPAFFDIKIGGTAPSQLTVLPGGELHSLHQIRVFRNIKGAMAQLDINGGSVRAGEDEKEPNLVRMFIGASGTFSSAGIVNIRSGTFQGGIVVGSALPDTGVGTLSIIGSAPTVGGVVKTRDSFVLYPKSTLAFVLDEKGVAPLNYPQSKVVLSEGATVRVDGTAYKGGPATLPLILTKNINHNARVECVGFPDNMQASVSKAANGLMLTIKR